MIAITGAATPLGRELIGAFREKNQPVRVVDRLEMPWFAGGEIVLGDWQDPPTIERTVRGARAVVHLAEAHPGDSRLRDFRSPDYDKELFRLNLEGTRRLAEAARDAGVGRFLFASSESVYGPPPPEYPCTEQAPTEPHGPYGRSKLEAELLLLEMQRRGELDPVILRLAPVLGPFYPRETVIRRFFELALRHLPIPVAGNGHLLKHCLHARDAAELAERCLARPQAGGRIYNAAGRGAATIRDIVKTVTEVLDSRSILMPVPPAALTLADRFGRMAGRPLIDPEQAQNPFRHTCFSTGRALAELGWRARYDTLETFAEAALWYRQHVRKK